MFHWTNWSQNRWKRMLVDLGFNLVGSISSFLARNITASTVPSAYIDLPQTLCWNSKETLQEKELNQITQSILAETVKEYKPENKRDKTENVHCYVWSGDVKWYIWNAWPDKCSSGTPTISSCRWGSRIICIWQNVLNRTLRTKLKKTFWINTVFPQSKSNQKQSVNQK